MAKNHSIVWIDHHKSVVWNFTDDEESKSVVKSHDQHEHTHLRSSPHGGHKAQGDHEFFEDVSKTLVQANEVLVIGPAATKDEFATFIRAKHPAIAACLVGVESADHPSDAELLAYARKHFKIIDRKI
jgi:stalled ribosome rescue protein Dom34